jgi:hypothetical protein
MAKSGERRMVFDTRGRRKHVVRVVYAILALLMGTSLFLVVGPFNLGEVIGGGGASSASEVLDEQAERVEARLRTDPDNDALLLKLARTRINAGNALFETNPQTGVPVATPEARVELEGAAKAWGRYLEEAKAPNPAAAGLMARTYFSLAESSTTYEEAIDNVENATEAQRLAAKARPNLGAFSTLAIYEYFAGDFAAGDRASARVKKLVPSKEERKAVSTQLSEYRKRGKEFAKQVRAFEKTQRGKGKEALQNPLGGLAGGGLGGTLGQ